MTEKDSSLHKTKRAFKCERGALLQTNRSGAKLTVLQKKKKRITPRFLSNAPSLPLQAPSCAVSHQEWKNTRCVIPSELEAIFCNP